MSVIACKHMQIYANILNYVYLKSQTPHRHTEPEGFAYFQIIEKYKNGTKEIDILILCFQIWGILVDHIFFSLLSLLVKILYSFIIICTVDLLQAQFPFSLGNLLRVNKTMSLYHFT